jgi:glycosyltransferase involved in cell wall biosynthesis
MSKRLLVVGSNSIHVLNFINLIQDAFDDVLLITNEIDSTCNIKSVVANFSIRKNGYKNFKTLKKLIDDFQPTVAHIHQADTKALLTLLALRKSSVKKVLTAWGSDILINPKKSIFSRWKVQFILQQVDAVTADSDAVLDEAEKLVGTLNRHNINFGIDVYPCHYKKESIIYSNRLHKKLYNIDKIILSFYQLIQRSSEWKLIIAGDGEEYKNLKVLVKRLGIEDSVKFVGWVDSQTNYEYYCKAKIYISIPQSDSISLSLVESIAASCIVFVSNIPANKEIISQNIGFFVDDLEQIDFFKFHTINPEKYKQEQKSIVDKFSKKKNRLKYLNLYSKI